MMKFPTVYFIIGDKAVGKTILAETLEQNGFLVIRPSYGPGTVAITAAFKRGDSVFVDVDAKNIQDTLAQIHNLLRMFRDCGYDEMRVINLSRAGRLPSIPLPTPKPKVVKRNTRGYSRSSGIGGKGHE